MFFHACTSVYATYTFGGSYGLDGGRRGHVIHVYVYWNPSIQAPLGQKKVGGRERKRERDRETERERGGERGGEREGGGGEVGREGREGGREQGSEGGKNVGEASVARSSSAQSVYSLQCNFGWCWYGYTCIYIHLFRLGYG